MTTKHEPRRIMPDDPNHWLERISPMVRTNSKPGSRVKAAFETLEAQWTREDGPTWGALHLAAEAWGELAEDEKQKILNGWRSRGALPKSAEAFGWIQNSAVANVLRIMCEVGGEVVFEVHPTNA